MTLRNTLSQIYPYLKNNEEYFFVFLIGSYPQRPESNHELPKILETLNKYERKVKCVYIDSDYSKESTSQLKERLGQDSIIYPKSINYEDYSMIIEFCHIAGILNNSLSIIFEFTGILRFEYERETNKTPYLYISPSECLADTNDILYNPIIETSDIGLSFYRPNLENIGGQIEYLFQEDINESKLQRLKFIKEMISFMVSDIKQVYRMLLNYIERKDCFDVDHDIVFIKEIPYFYPSIELLKKRMIGYHSYKTRNIIDEFLNSECDNLEIYLKERIQIFLGIILLYIHKGNRLEVNNNFEKIMFDNSRQVYEIVNKLEMQI